MQLRGALLSCAFIASAGLLAHLSTKIAPPAPEPARYSLCRAPRTARRGVVLSRGLLAAAVLSLDATAEQSLLQGLRDSNERWIATRNPLFVALTEDDPDAALTRALRHGPPAVAVAAAASAETVCAVDDLCVRVTRGRCAAESALSAHDLERARFLSWPFGHGVIVRPASSIADAATTLRRAAEGSSTIGLVVTWSDRDDAERLHAELTEAFRRHEALSGRSEESSASNDATDLAATKEGEIIVLPRLAAVSDPFALTREIHRALPGAKVDPAVR